MIITKNNITAHIKTDLIYFCANESIENFLIGHYKFDILPWLHLPVKDRELLLKFFEFNGFDDAEEEYYMIFVTDTLNDKPVYYLIITDFPFEYYDIKQELTDACNTEQLFYRFKVCKIEQ